MQFRALHSILFVPVKTAGAFADRMPAMWLSAAGQPSISGPDEAAPPPDVKRMTKAELRRLGTPQFVYLRAGTVEGQAAYAIHAADGTAMAIVEDVELAVELATEHGLRFVTVH
jgi:hypothetical protein